jgi:hypothetical protein
MNSTLVKRVLPGVSAVALALCAGVAIADNGDSRTIHARLTGYQEVPSVSTAARGEFKGKIDRRTGVIDYRFSYEGLQGAVRQAHIHFAQPGVNGSIVVWLCGTPDFPGPDGTPTCTLGNGSFTGVIDAVSVLAASMPAQQLAAGELDELIAAIRAGVTYVNVHTNDSPGGEIRGQLRRIP